MMQTQFTGPRGGPAVLAVWNNHAGAEAGPGEAEYHAWYEEEHVPQRLGFPGFREARRYEAVAADRRFLTWYTLDGMAALRHPDYLACLAEPTPRTRAAMAGFRGMIRAELLVAEAAGDGEGGHVVCLRRDTGAVDPASVARWVAEPGVVAVQLWAAPPGAAPAASPETRFRGGPDGTASGALLLGCAGPEHAARVAALLDAETAGDGAAHVGRYRLLSRVGAGGG